MYVVGANLLSEFWQRHPECEGELRALHALLASCDAAHLSDLLGEAGTMAGATCELDLAESRIRLELNEAAGIARIANVQLREES